MTSTAFDLSAADFAAIEFYEEHRAAVEAYGLLSVFGEDRDDRRQFNKGKKLIAAGIAAAQSIRAPRRGSAGTAWTQPELDFITDLYLKHVRPEQEHDARATILREFRTRFATHTDDAVELTVRRIIRLDTAYPSDGMLGAHVGYFNLLDQKCPGRFEAPAAA